MELSEKIKMLRIQNGLTLEEVGNIVGVGKSTVRKWESGEIANMRRDKIALLAKALHVTPGYLMGWEADAANEMTAKVILVPVLGTIPAGITIEAIEDVLDWEELPGEMARGGKEYFALRIKGDSMYPRYETGDVVIFRKQDTCENGQDCAVMVNGDDATFKRVRLSENGITLQPLNPEYEPMVYSNEDVLNLPVRIIGVAVELRRKF